MHCGCQPHDQSVQLREAREDVRRYANPTYLWGSGIAGHRLHQDPVPRPELSLQAIRLNAWYFDCAHSDTDLRSIGRVEARGLAGRRRPAFASTQ